MSDTHDRFTAAVETATRLDNDWRALERRIRATVPDLQSASYDSEPRDPVVWCDLHERAVAVCRKHDEFCTGVPMPPKVDPTGDGAVGNHAWEDAGAFAAHAKKVAHHVEQMAVIAQRYKPDDPHKAASVEQSNDRSACEVCARSEKYVAKATTITVGGRQLDSCDWHYRFHKDHGRLPTTEEEATHQRGKRVTVRVMQMDRLRRGLVDGLLR